MNYQSHQTIESFRDGRFIIHNTPHCDEAGNFSGSKNLVLSNIRLTLKFSWYDPTG